VTQPADLLFQFFNEVGLIAQRGQTVFERVMPEAMTLAQFTVLDSLVQAAGPGKPGDLARALHVTKATMSSTLQRLDSKGLVRMVADPDDGRSKNVDVTAAGRKMHSRCHAALGGELERLVPQLAPGDIEALVPWLCDIRTALETERD
jgi:DNA-binding MarR family transcriptional regulator